MTIIINWYYDSAIFFTDLKQTYDMGEVLKQFLLSISGTDIMLANNNEYGCIKRFMKSDTYKQFICTVENGNCEARYWDFEDCIYWQKNITGSGCSGCTKSFKRAE